MADGKVKNYAEQKAVREKAQKLYAQILAGYKEEKKSQNEAIDDYWDIYNCELGDNQQYVGESAVYEPIVRDALEARRKRFTAMLFPNIGNNIEVVSETGEIPQAETAILQRHVRSADLRSVCSALFLSGDIEGQWSLMVDWKRDERKITRKVKKTVDEVEDVQDVEEETIVTERPEVSIVPAQDLWVFPATVSNLQDAEIVSVALRLTDEALDRMVDEGKILQKQVDKLAKDAGEDKAKWAAKARAADAGIKLKAGQKFTLVYMAFVSLKLDDEKQAAIVFFGGEDNVLGVIKNPHWSKKVPIVSEPVERVAGSFWGKSKVAPVAALAYQLNDITNMGMDSASFSVMPIVMTDPLKNPRVGSMIQAMGAIWETSPNDTKLVEFPALYQHAMNLRNQIKAQIMESMDVNEVMLGKAPAGRKNAQAVAQQSAEALATMGDVVKRFENGVMNQLLEWFYEMDLQFRDDELLIVREGEHGMQAKVEAIPPMQYGSRYFFKWNGADQAMGAQRVQQMIGFMNVLRGMPPQVLNGRKLDIGPLLDFASQAIFGPTLAQNVLIDERHKMAIPPEVENEMLLNNLPVQPSPMDDDIAHIQSHQQAAQMTGDTQGAFRAHIAQHAQALQAKAQAANPKPQGQQGVPGGGGQPGVAGTPRPGAIPAGPRGGQNPAGAIHSDQMADASAGMRG